MGQPREEADPREPIAFVTTLNSELKKYIRSSIELPPTDNQPWNTLDHLFRPVRCHVIKRCEATNCVAYNSQDSRCWLQAGTLCGGVVQGEFARKCKSCFRCEVMEAVTQDPLRELYENIGILVHHLQGRVSRAQKRAIRDPLTRLFNRHFFSDLVRGEAPGLVSQDTRYSVIMLDMDGFKQVNDTLGHLAGDRLLVEMARVLTAVRRSDWVFRLGGDEFLILLEDPDAQTKEVVARRIRAAAEAWNKAHATEFGFKLAFSLGTATCDELAKIYEALEEADRMMYEEKRKHHKAFG